MTKPWKLLWPLIHEIPGMDAFQINCEGTFKDEKSLMWEMFHAIIDEPLNLKCGTIVYAYINEVELELRLPDPDYRIFDEDGDEIWLFQLDD